MYQIGGGVLLGWTLGANDSANVFGPGVASGAVRFRTATLLTAFFALVGALVEGPRCMETVGAVSRIIPLWAFLCTLAAGLTMLLLTFLSLPASSSQALVGALIGIGIWNSSVRLAPLAKMVICWAATPLGGAFLAYVLYRMIGALMKRYAGGVRRFDTIVRWCILLAGCYGAYTLGANNVANATGPFVASGQIDPALGALVGGVSIGLGAITFSRGVMMTVGARITALGPLAALVAILAEALTVHAFTLLGVPVSTSQAVVGCVAGIGMVRGVHALSRRTLAKIFVGWTAAPAVAGALAYGAAAAWTALAS